MSEKAKNLRKKLSERNKLKKEEKKENEPVKPNIINVHEETKTTSKDAALDPLAFISGGDLTTTKKEEDPLAKLGIEIDKNKIKEKESKFY